MKQNQLIYKASKLSLLLNLLFLLIKIFLTVFEVIPSIHSFVVSLINPYKYFVSKDLGLILKTSIYL